VDLALYDWSIGISDIIQHRTCPQRFAYGMRRHVELPPHIQITPNERDEPPESTNWTNVAGSAAHLAIHEVDVNAVSHDEAISRAMREYGAWLTPEDVAQLREDLTIFETRRPHGVTLVCAEQDMRVPLFIDDGGHQVYFRFKVDVLSRLIASPDVFLHRDYKTSKWRKTDAEVHKDVQLWAYNWGLHEAFPEIRHLLQTYDQLRFGEVPTTKNEAQRAQIKDWLIEQVKFIQADTVYKPKRNEWCRYCPMVVTCRETYRATKAARAELAITAPLTREGRKVKVALAVEGDELEALIRDELPTLIAVRKHIAHVEEELKRIIGTMPEQERARLGWKVTDRTTKTITTPGLRALHELIGDAFYDLVSLSMTAVETEFGKPKRGEPLSPELEAVRAWTVEATSGVNVLPAGSAE